MTVSSGHTDWLYIVASDRSDHGNRRTRLFLWNPPVPGLDTLGAGADKGDDGEG